MSIVRVFVVLAMLVVRAHAGTVGIVVTGDATLQPTLTKQLEAWLRAHGHTVGEPLPADATTILLDCMVIDDEACARGIVDARAKTDSVVFAEARASRTKASTATTLIVYWLVKGKEPVGMRRACDDCNEDLMKSALAEILKTVVGASELERGRLALTSKPAGLTVMLDNENIGITPLEREVAAGEHTIVLMSRGHKVAERKLKIHPQVTAEIMMTATMPPADAGERPSRLVPGLMLGVGGTAIAAGAVLFFTSDVDDGSKPYYRDSRPHAIGIAAGGVALAAVGTFLWFRAGRADSSPVVAVDRDGGMVGWSRAF